MKKVSDQIVILSSIKHVRRELELAIVRGEGTNDIWNRLTALYLLLDSELILESLRHVDSLRRVA
jgi:hypothetical protein